MFRDRNSGHIPQRNPCSEGKGGRNGPYEADYLLSLSFLWSVLATYRSSGALLAVGTADLQLLPSRCWYALLLVLWPVRLLVLLAVVIGTGMRQLWRFAGVGCFCRPISDLHNQCAILNLEMTCTVRRASNTLTEKIESSLHKRLEDVQ